MIGIFWVLSNLWWFENILIFYHFPATLNWFFLVLSISEHKTLFDFFYFNDIFRKFHFLCLLKKSRRKILYWLLNFFKYFLFLFLKKSPLLFSATEFDERKIQTEKLSSDFFTSRHKNTDQKRYQYKCIRNSIWECVKQRERSPPSQNHSQ